MMAYTVDPRRRLKKGILVEQRNDYDADAKSVGSHDLDQYKSKSKMPSPLPFPTKYNPDPNQPSSAPPYVDTVVKVVDGLKWPVTAAMISNAINALGKDLPKHLSISFQNQACQQSC